MAEIEGIPTFPEAVNKVLDLCDDPLSDMSQVTHAIEKDPALSVDILKIANSGGFITAQKVGTLSGAVGILGLKVIRQIAVATAARQILNSHFKAYRGFWDHAFHVAFYSKQLAERYKMTKAAETVYIGGLLHELGKIVLYEVSPKLIKEMDKWNVDSSKRTSSTLEEIEMGISHARIGALVAKEWQFSEELVAMIRHYQNPFAAPDEYRELASIIHIANAFVNIELKHSRYFQIDRTAAQVLKLNSEEDYENLHNWLKQTYADVKD